MQENKKRIHRGRLCVTSSSPLAFPLWLKKIQIFNFSNITFAIL